MTVPVSVQCPVCTGKIQVRECELYDDRYGEPNMYHLARCRDCSHLMTMPRLRESDLPALYGTYYPRKYVTAVEVKNEAASVDGPFARLFRWLAGTDNQGQYSARAGDRVLDVGCGSGVSLLEAQALGARAFGIEADPNVQPIAAALGLNVHFGSLHDTPFPGEYFDLIIMNQVIEHIPEPDEALKLVRERLAKGGRIILVFPNQSSLGRRLTGRRWIHWHIPFHLHHFDIQHITALSRRCNLKVVRTRTITPNVWTLLQIRALPRVVPRGEPNPIWAATKSDLDKVDSGAKSGSIVRRTVLFACLATIALFNRSVDCLGLGESLLVELRDGE